MATIKKAQTGKTVKSTNPADSYPAKKDKRGKATIGGGEGKIPSGPSTGRRKPTMGSAKNGKSFPDLNKDGKVTKADILKGRGVIAKSGAKMKKAQNGMSSVPRNSSGEVTVGGVNPYKTGGPKPSLSAGFKAGGKIKKCKTGCK